MTENRNCVLVFLARKIQRLKTKYFAALDYSHKFKGNFENLFKFYIFLNIYYIINQSILIIYKNKTSFFDRFDFLIKKLVDLFNVTNLANCTFNTYI